MCVVILLFFFFNDTATTEIYTLSLHDALPISWAETERTLEALHQARGGVMISLEFVNPLTGSPAVSTFACEMHRSEEHTSELQSRRDLVCRLLLEKKKKKK